MAGERRRNEERTKFWSGVMTDQRSSGLSVAQFCRDRQLNQASFYAWRRKLATARSTGSSAGTEERLSQFIPVSLVDSSAKPSCFELKLPNGIRLTVPPQFDSATLAELIQAASLVEIRHA